MSFSPFVFPRASVLRRQRYLLCCALVLLAAGCGSQGTRRAPVVGKITLGGQPIAGANVTFVPVEAGAPSATGTTDQDGKYRLQTLGRGPGALVGEHRVCVALRVEAPAGKSSDPNYLRNKMRRPMGKPLLPERYFDPDKSGLTAEVVDVRENRFDFDLQP
jgi:hypothetical protein